MPVGFYRILGTSTERNVLVLLCLPKPVAEFAHERGYVPNGNCPSGVAPVGKPVLAVAGDTVVLTAEGVQISGRLLPNSKPLPRDSEGRPLPMLALGRYVLRPGEMWLLSTYSERSFDSRYFGPVRTTGVVAVIKLVFEP